MANMPPAVKKPELHGEPADTREKAEQPEPVDAGLDAGL